MTGGGSGQRKIPSQISSTISSTRGAETSPHVLTILLSAMRISIIIGTNELEKQALTRYVVARMISESVSSAFADIS